MFRIEQGGTLSRTPSADRDGYCVLVFFVVVVVDLEQTWQGRRQRLPVS